MRFRKLPMLALILAATLPLRDGNANNHSPGERPAMKCYQSYSDSNKEVCEASIYAVIANPDRYEGRNVRVTGYLRRVHDVLVVYPSRDAYLYSAGRDGIELLVERPDHVEAMQGKDEFDGAATVIGVFTTGLARRVPGAVGVVTGEITVFAEEEPDSPPKLPPNR